MRHTLIATINQNQCMTRKLMAIKKDFTVETKLTKDQSSILGRISKDFQLSVERTTNSVNLFGALPEGAVGISGGPFYLGVPTRPTEAALEKGKSHPIS